MSASAGVDSESPRRPGAVGPQTPKQHGSRRTSFGSPPGGAAAWAPADPSREGGGESTRAVNRPQNPRARRPSSNSRVELTGEGLREGAWCPPRTFESSEAWIAPAPAPRSTATPRAKACVAQGVVLRCCDKVVVHAGLRWVS